MSSPDKSVLKVAPCSHEAAKYAVENWHYSRKAPVGKLVKFGIWEDGRFVGSVIYSCGSAGVGSMGKSFGLKNTEVVELARVALTKHRTSVSKIVSVTMRLLKREQSGIRMAVSYADPLQQHVGTIYQAMNWAYVGRSSKDTAYIDASGKRWHSRSVSESGWKVHMGIRTRCPKPSTMKSVDVEPKYKYLYPLDEAMKRKIEPLRKPYPKRAGSSSVEHHVSNGEVGGSIPTPALQSITVE